MYNPIKIFYNWRYWPKEILYFPLAIKVFIFGAIRTGRIFYFSAANPNVSLGGFASDSKFKIHNNIPIQYKPITALILKSDVFSEVLIKMVHEGIRFPLIVKPDIGEGGFLVKKINTSEELEIFHQNHNMDYLLQEFIDLPIEVSILVHDASGQLEISSITEREYITFIGDGKSNIKKLISENRNSKYRQRKIKYLLHIDLGKVLHKDEVWKPITIGNWDYGATYTNRSNFMTKEMTNSFQAVNNQVGLFHYARYDIKCSSMESLAKGDFIIIEINGVKGEPIHIYDLGTNLVYAYKEIFKHWNYIMVISIRNMKKGAKPTPFLPGIKILYHHLITKRQSVKPK
jgi:hypothetical protein